MLDPIKITAEYSNAVLVAILPQVSDFVGKLNVPVLAPISLRQVAESRCWPTTDDVGGAVILTNGLLCGYQHGYVTGFRTPDSYHNLQDPAKIPRFYGTLRMSEGEALKLARASILKLGYGLKDTFTDQQPEIDQPPRLGTNVVPYYRFQWKDPVFSGTAVSSKWMRDGS